MLPEKRMIKDEVILDADIDSVWEAWTTEKGAKTFFAPDCKIEFEIDGRYEMYFNPEDEEGKRGSEGAKILAIEEKKMFSFTWSAPPNIPDIRKQNTHVALYFEELEDNSTKITMINDGYGFGKEWRKAYQYFQIAWKEIVLPRLIYRFEEGPVDWENPPKLR